MVSSQDKINKGTEYNPMPNNNREYNNGPSINNRYINDPKVKGDIKK
jgi:hypothetical protein